MDLEKFKTRVTKHRDYFLNRFKNDGAVAKWVEDMMHKAISNSILEILGLYDHYGKVGINRNSDFGDELLTIIREAVEKETAKYIASRPVPKITREQQQALNKIYQKSYFNTMKEIAATLGEQLAHSQMDKISKDLLEASRKKLEELA